MQIAVKQVAKRQIKKQVKKQIAKKIKKKIKEKIREKIEEKIKEKIKEKATSALDRFRRSEIDAADDELYIIHGINGPADDDEERDTVNVYLKYLIGFVCGCALIYIMYLIFVALMDFDSNAAIAVSAILGLFVSFGLAFSRTIRCVVMLILPTFFAGKGRTLLMVYGVVLVASGPMMNVNHNLDIANESMACGASLAKNQSRALYELMTSPLSAIADKIEGMIQDIEDMLRGLMDTIKNFKNSIKRIIGSIKKFFQWLQDALDQCNANLGSPEMLCRRKFQEVGETCRAKRRNIAHGFCNLGESLQFICAPLKVIRIFCIVHKLVNIVASAVANAFDIAIDGIELELWVHINYTHYFQLDVDFDKSADEIKAAMLEDVKARTRVFSEITGCMGVVLSFSCILIIIKAWRYRTSYLVKDHFDNFYITKHVRTIDKRRKKLKKPSIFPLRRKEKYKYPRPNSMPLSPKEKRKLKFAFFKWGINALWAAVVIGADYTIYKFFNLVNKHAELRVMDDPTSKVKLVVSGYGVLADVYRKLVETVDPSERFRFEIDTTKCLPIATPPDSFTNTLIGIIFGIYLVCLIFEAYGLRLRRTIAAYFYPERERERALWLYNHILRKRGTFSDFIWNKLKQMVPGEPKEREKVSLANTLASKSRILGEILNNLGYKTMLCSTCGHPGDPDDKERFRHCDNAGCTGVFCLQCVMDINGVCTRCMFPVEYEVLDVHIQFERDSSDDELAVNEEQRALISKESTYAGKTTETIIDEIDD